MLWENLRCDEFKAAVEKSNGVCAIPIGCVEAHGIHLPLGCDTLNGVNGSIKFFLGDITISLSGLAVAALVGIVVNAVLPGNDYQFGANEQGDKSVNFKV